MASVFRFPSEILGDIIGHLPERYLWTVRLTGKTMKYHADGHLLADSDFWLLAKLVMSIEETNLGDPERKWTAIPRQSDWDRFKSYSVHVKSLSLVSLRTSHTNIILQFLAYLPRNKEFFPHLNTLKFQMNSNTPTAITAHSFMWERINTLKLDFNYGDSLSACEAASREIEAIPKRLGTHLRCLELTGNLNINIPVGFDRTGLSIAGVLTCCVGVTEVKVDSLFWDVDSLAAASKLSNLKKLVIISPSSDSGAVIPFSLPPNSSEGQNDTSRGQLFPSLKSLDVGIVTPGHDSIQLIQYDCPMLERLEIRVLDANDANFPVLSFSKATLRTFIVTKSGKPLNIHADDIISLAKNLPKVEHLSLNPEPDYLLMYNKVPEVKISFEILKELAKHSPNLQVLELLLSAPSPDDDIPVTGAHWFQELRQLNTGVNTITKENVHCVGRFLSLILPRPGGMLGAGTRCVVVSKNAFNNSDGNINVEISKVRGYERSLGELQRNIGMLG